MATSDKPPKRIAKGQHKQTDPAQSKRFIKAARERGGDEDPDAYDRVFKNLSKQT